MAQPIREIRSLSREEQLTEDQSLRELTQALLHHREAVLQTLQLIQSLHDRGLIEMTNSLLASGDKVLASVLEELNKPPNSRALANLLSLIQLLGSLDVQRLKPLAESLNAVGQAAAETASSANSVGLWKLLQSLRDPEIMRGLNFGLSLLKGVGQAIGDKPQSPR